MSLKYKINVLEKLKECGINTNKLRKEKLLSEGVIQALREKKPISWANISKICEMLTVNRATLWSMFPKRTTPTKPKNNNSIKKAGTLWNFLSLFS